MNKKGFPNKNLFKLNNRYFNRQINRIIIVLIILIGIYIIKIINTNTTNKVLGFIERNIYYDFSIKEDGKKVKDTLIKIVKGSKGTLEEFTENMVNRK